MTKPKRQKHNYTSELELKSLLIRSKNKKLQNNPEPDKHNTIYNSIINRYIKTYVKMNNMNYAKGSLKLKKRKALKIKLKQRIITMSEQTFIDYDSNERFGKVILLMIKNILTKPNFSGYTYQTEFYSDAISKILKYLHNFDHTMISKISNTHVNSFAYISQIIHNSIIFIINKKKKEQININKQVSNEILQNDLNIADHRKALNASTIYDDDESFGFTKEIPINYYISDDDLSKTSLVNNIKIILDNKKDNEKPIIVFSKNIILTMDDYNELCPFIKNADIIKERQEDTHEEIQEDTHEDTQEDTHEDTQEEIQEDTQEDTHKDTHEDTQEGETNAKL